MAIDPGLITTVNAEELPVAPVTLDSVIVHSIGGILYQGTVSEVTALVTSVNYKPYEVKQLNVTDLYITQNFEENGLGKTDGLWNGWAIIDGGNGTGFSADGCTFIGWGSAYNTMRQEVGENSKTIVKANVPELDLSLDTSRSDNGDDGTYVVSAFTELIGNRTYTNVVNAGSPNTPLSIMQKSRVQLFIMKLP